MSTAVARIAAPAVTDQAETVRCVALKPGQSGTIMRIEADPHLAARLKALGVRPGLNLKVIRRAPWGCPLEVAVRNVHLALRREDAEAIHVALGRD